MDCALCDAKKERYRIVVENEHALCIVDIAPLKLGHVLVLPKEHRPSLTSLNHEEFAAISSLIEKMRPIAKQASGGDDPIIHLNTGKHSTEEHLHFHIVPSKGGLRPLVSGYEGCAERERVSEVRMEEIKEELQRILHGQ